MSLNPDLPTAWSADPAEKVKQLTRQLKLAREQLDKKSDLCDELAEQIHGPVTGGDDGDAWSVDPAQKVVQLTRQLKFARVQLDKKSDLCDEFAEQIHNLEEDLGKRNAAAQDALEQYRAAGAELRAAARAHSFERRELEETIACAEERSSKFSEEMLERRELEESIASAEGKSMKFREEALGLEAAVDEGRALAVSLAARLSEAEEAEQRHDAKLGSATEAHSNEVAEFLCMLSSEKSAALEVRRLESAALAELSADFREGEEEWARQEARMESAAETDRAAESVSVAERLRCETEEFQRQMKAVLAASDASAASWESAHEEEMGAATRTWQSERLHAARELEGAEEELDRVRREHVELAGAASLLEGMHAETAETLSERDESLEALVREQRLEAVVAIEREELQASTADECERLKATIAELHAKLEASMATAAAAEGASTAAVLEATAREQRLEQEVARLRAELKEVRQALEQEKELHDGAVRMLEVHRDINNEKSKEIGDELEHLSGELEQKEDDMMAIQFAMVEVQNKLADQVRLCAENAEELERGNVKLEEKDERLKVSLRRQEELTGQMNEATSRLQEKVAQLSTDLERSRSAHQALDEQTRMVVDRLERSHGEVDGLTEQLEQARADYSELSAVADESARSLTCQYEAAEDCEAALELRLQRSNEQVVDLTGQLEQVRAECTDAANDARTSAAKSISELEARFAAEEAAALTRCQGAALACERKLQEELIAADHSLKERIAELGVAQRALEMTEVELAAHAGDLVRSSNDELKYFSELKDHRQQSAVVAEGHELNLQEAHAARRTALEEIAFYCDEVTSEKAANSELERITEEHRVHLEQRLKSASLEHEDRLRAAEAMLHEVRTSCEERAVALEQVRASETFWQREVEVQGESSAEHQEASVEAKIQVAGLHGRVNAQAEEYAQLLSTLRICESELQRRRAAEEVADSRTATACEHVESLEAQLASMKDREKSLAAASRRAEEDGRNVQERLTVAEERLDSSEAKLCDLQAALQRSRLLERQAIERTQELRTKLMIIREFGREDFMNIDVPCDGGDVHGNGNSGLNECIGAAGDLDEQLGAAVPTVLISVQLALAAGTATLSVAPWQTRADFESVVNAFLLEHRVRPMFADSLVRYLEQVDDEAVSFPVIVQASLADIYSRFG